MLKKLKHTLSSTAIYSFGNALTKLIGVILLPLYTSELSVSEYGIWAIFETLSLIFVSIFALNIPTALLRWCASEKDKIKEKSIIFSSFLFMVIVAVCLFITTYPNSEFISRLVWPNIDYTYFFELIFISIFFEILGRHPITLIRLREKQFFYVFVTSVKLIVILSLNIYFIVGLDKGIDGIILSRIIGQVVFLVLMMPFLFKNFNFRIEKEILIEMLKYSTPLILTTLSNFAFTQSDRFIIPLLIGENSLGIYSVGLKFASIMNMFLIQSFNLGFLPIAFKMFDQPGYNRYFSKIMTYYTLILVFTGLAISLFGKELIEIFVIKTEYWDSYKYIPLLALGFVLKGMNQVFILGFHYKKTTSKLAFIVVVCSILSIGFNFIFLPQIGLYAAPIAVIFSMILMNILSINSSSKLLKIDFEYSKLVLLIVLGVIIYLSTITLNEWQFIIRVSIKLSLLLSFPFLLFLLKFYEPIEIERIKQILSKWNKPSEWKSMLRND